MITEKLSPYSEAILMDITTLETIIPSRFVSFTIPNPSLPTHFLRVAVLDSPFPLTNLPQLSALFVPFNRESDWLFSTESGHLQLLLSIPQVSRLIIIGPNPVELPEFSPAYCRNTEEQEVLYTKNLETTLNLIIPCLIPRNCVKDSIIDVPISVFEDNVICRVVLEKCVGDFVGEMLVEDVEIECDDRREFRRRLRFKSMPLLIQTEVRIVPDVGFALGCVRIDELKFKVDLEVLVHAYFGPMVAGVSLIASCIEELFRKGFRPKALCLGVGGGGLLSFLKTQLGFDVYGVEIDRVVLRVAKQYFGFEDIGIQVCVGDALEFVEKLAGFSDSMNSDSDKVEEEFCLDCSADFCTKFDIVMVDLNSSDAVSGSAPPLEFTERHFLLAVRSLLSDFGILVVNTILPNKSIYNKVVNEFRDLFDELYEIDVGNDENFVLIAKVTPVFATVDDGDNVFLQKLKMAISGRFIDSIRKI